jgi:1-deoxy-D-xylulose-5-phosphate reductoisomerase
MPAVLNAANEVAVEAFLQGRLRFVEIPALIETTMNRVVDGTSDSIEGLLQLDGVARREAASLLPSFTS